MTEAWEINLAKLLWEARTVDEIHGILAAAELRYGLKRIPVGRPNNIGTIRMASDPGLAMIERITNAIDGLAELGVMLNPGRNPKTPEEAAHLLFGVPEGGLQDMTEKERRALAEKLVVSIHESGVTKRPSLRVQDHGIGQHPSDFSKTLLSLNESNKVGKPYTMGTYGQGGSVTLGFSAYTLIMSRRHPSLLPPEVEDLIGWTVAFEDETDPAENVLPQYVWVVRPDGRPFTLSPALLPELHHGTRITHINYDMQGLQGPFTTQMWQFLNATLFDPTLPFILTGDRKNDIKKADGTPDSRVIIGNATRLANIGDARGDIALGAYDSHDIDLGPGYGSIQVDWWALVRPEGSASTSEPAGSYVQANNAVSLTLHGQRQDAERRTWIKDRAMLPFLYKNIVVHINANGLGSLGRRELFASTRERATESELRKHIYDLVANLIRSNEDLKRLNHEEKEKLLKRSTAATNDKIRKRLGRFIMSKLKDTVKAGGSKTAAGKGHGTGSGGFGENGTEPGAKKTHGGGGGGGRNTDDTNLPHVPTEMRFESQKLRVAQGRSGFVWVAINAKNGYLPRHNDDLVIAILGAPKDKLWLSSKSKLLGGRTRWSLLAASDAPVGAYNLSATLTTANGELKASIPVEIVVPPKEAGVPTGGTDEDTGPEVRWVTKANWNGRYDVGTVGIVDEDDESTIIWVNRDFDLLAKALASSKLTPEAIQTRADRYQYPIACGLWLQHHDLQTADPQPHEDYLRRELQRLGEAVLAAMDPDVELAGIQTEG